MRYLLYSIIGITFIFMVECKKKDTTPVTASIPDIITGLVVNIPFDSSTQETVRNTYGKATDGAYYITDHLGRSSRAMCFQRIDTSYVDFGTLPGASFTNNIFTISCWVNVYDTTSPIAILSKRSLTGPYEYSIDNHFNHTYFAVDNWLADGSTTVYGTDPLNAYAAVHPYIWEHIAYVADGNTLKVYVNGVLQTGTDTHDIGNNFTATSGHLVIGDGGGWGKNYYFDGGIDDIKMYNRALQLNAIQYLATH